MLMVTTTMRMVNRVHGNTTRTGPAAERRPLSAPFGRVGQSREYTLVALGLVLVVRTAGLEQGLVDPPTARNDADRRAAAPRDGLLRAARQADAGLVLVRRVADDGRVVARRARERAAVAGLLLDVAHDRALRALRHGEHVADGERRLLAAVDEGAGVQALGRDEGLFAELVAVRVAEDDAGEGGAAVLAMSVPQTQTIRRVAITHRPASWMISFTMPLT